MKRRAFQRAFPLLLLAGVLIYHQEIGLVTGPELSYGLAHAQGVGGGSGCSYYCVQIGQPGLSQMDHFKGNTTMVHVRHACIRARHNAHTSFTGPINGFIHCVSCHFVPAAGSRIFWSIICLYPACFRT